MDPLECVEWALPGVRVRELVLLGLLASLGESLHLHCCSSRLARPDLPYLINVWLSTMKPAILLGLVCGPLGTEFQK